MLYPMISKYIHILGTFTKIDYILVHRAHVSKFQMIEIIQSMFSDHTGIISEISNE